MVALGAALGEHLLELLLETISCSPDEGFDLSFGGSRSGICALPHYVAVSARLCNRRINAVKLGNLDPPFAELPPTASDLTAFDRPQDLRCVQTGRLGGRCQGVVHAVSTNAINKLLRDNPAQWLLKR